MCVCVWVCELTTYTADAAAFEKTFNNKIWTEEKQKKNRKFLVKPLQMIRIPNPGFVLIPGLCKRFDKKKIVERCISYTRSKRN